MKEAGEDYGMPIISEIISPEYADMMNDYVDVFQIGARNMQNFELLKCVGALQRPVMLKRGLAATIEEWLMAAEYLLAHGAEDVILFERGIRTFETYTRNSLDISSIPVIKKLSHLPVMVDPSHATGIREKVLPVGLAAIAAGADGLIIEVHPNPDAALSDGPQSLYPDQFEKLMRDIEAMSPVLGKELARLPEKHETSPALRGVDSREKKAGLTVAFQGEHGAYSEIAINRYFHSDDLNSLPRPGFRDVFTSVLEDNAEYGLVPIENSLAGSIHENYDLLLQYPDIKIVGETMIRIVHTLIGLPGAEMKDIRRVYSHPQGLAQTGRFLQQYPEWEKVPFYDTAGSVSYIAQVEQKENAAIAGSEAAVYYGMKVLKEGIETNPQNYTRFFVITRIEHEEIKNPNKASIVFSTPDKPGALLKCMKVLSDRKLNMKKLESRPILGKPWEYMFYADIEIPSEGADFSAGIEELKELSEDFKILGVYKA
jgi:prephenate dehydratase